MNTPRDQDVLGDRLRDALHREADQVRPAGDGLARIREGIDARQARIWWRMPALALGAAALVGVALGGVLLRGGDQDATKLPAATSSPTVKASDDPTSAPSTEPSSEGTTTPTAAAPPVKTTTSPPAVAVGPVSVFVYYVRDDRGTLRLYREQHTAAGHAKGRAAAAVTEMFGDSAVDPDYSSPWQAGTKVIGYTRTGSLATVNVTRFPAVGSAAEAIAVQQLVYTVTANDTAAKRVRLTVNGKTPSSGHADLSAPQARAPMLDVQGLIWILAPKQGQRTGSPVTVTVFGTAFEGNVTLRVFEGDQEVASDFVTTAMGEFRQASTTFTLDPGGYTVRAYDENAENGDLLERDSKSFTVD